MAGNNFPVLGVNITYTLCLPECHASNSEVLLFSPLISFPQQEHQPMNIRKVTKAVFPVAGLGTRFLPATKASPKEMLPIVDNPLIQYAVEEAAAAGITEMIFVTSQSKRAIEDHFDRSWELESLLAKRQKDELLQLVQQIKPAHVNCIYVRQAEALGLGHAVLCAESAVGNAPFAVLLADDLLDAVTPVLRQMLQIYERH